jgi:tetratricopeptide (TPR) repeat protein/tRNA A-37 threonylcarbamoyl transferase component Bud32
MPSADRPDGPTHAQRTEVSPADGDLGASRTEDGSHWAETVLDDATASPTKRDGRSGPTSGAVADLDDFKHALVELGLASDAELGAFEVDASSGVLGLARALVRAGRLTPYQSAAIYQKKSRGLLIGDYLILDKLGQGGMGVVFKARHRQTGRLGAVKILPPSFARNRTTVMRFKREIELAGRLKHPNLVRALDAAEDRGLHFLVMEYVAGSDLDHLVRSRGPMSPFEAIDSVIQAARGLEAAHAALIVHRDIKPGNLMLDDTGTIRVLDLGLARFVEAANPFGRNSDSRLTGSGVCMGTVDFMAPEQAEDSRRADHRADIYSLGCTLYYLLTGREPFPAPTVLKRIMAHQREPVPKLRAARPDAPIKLESVFQKMLAKEPADRPAAMGELIELLHPCRLAAASVAATRTASGDRVAGAPAQTATLAEAALKRTAIQEVERGAAIPRPRSQTGAPRIDQELRFEDLAMDVRIDDPLVDGLPITLASQSLGRSTFSRPGFRRSTGILQRLEVVVTGLFALALVGALLARVSWFSGSAKTPLLGPTDARGGTAVAANDEKESGGDRHPSADASAPQQTNLDAPGPAASIAMAGIERPKAISSSSAARSAGTHAKLATSAMKPATFDAKLKTVAAWPLAPAAPFVEVGRMIGHDHPWIEGICALRNGRALLSGGCDNTVRLWDTASGRALRCLWHPNAVRAIAALPDGQSAVTGCVDGWVRLWDLGTGQEVRRLARHSARVNALAISPDGRTVVSGGDDRLLLVSDVERGGEIRRFKAQTAPLWSVAISADGQLVLAGGKDGVVRLGKMSSRDSLEPLVGHDPEARILSLGFSPDGRRAASGGEDGSVIVWDLNRKQMARRLSVKGEGWVRSVVFWPDGETVAFGTQTGTLTVWDPRTGARQPEIRSGQCHSAMTVLPGGRLATADADGIVRIWEASPEIGLAREQVSAGRGDRALAEYNKAVRAHPDDARLLIERGRLLAELDRMQAADADFARGGALASDNPQLFLDTGWWVAGPYSLALSTPSPIEAAGTLYPATPPPPSGQEPRRWQRVATTMNDLVEMRAVSRTDEANLTCYALAIVHSLTERNVVLLVGSDDESRIWLNGERVLDSPQFRPREHYAIEATLNAGRNTILAKVVNQGQAHGLFLRIGSEPRDFLRVHVAGNKWEDAARDYDEALAREPSISLSRFFIDGGKACAELGRWKDATTAFERALEVEPENYSTYDNLLHACLAEGDLAKYRQVYQQACARFEAKTELAMINNLAWLAALVPRAVESKSRDDHFLRRAKTLIDTKEPPSSYLSTYGALLYRAGQLKAAINFLTRSVRDPADINLGTDCAFLAMARHRLKQGDAKAALERARELASRRLASWHMRTELRALLAEAETELKPPAVR